MLFRMRLCKKTHTRRTSLFCMYLSWRGEGCGCQAQETNGHVSSQNCLLALMTSHDEMQLEM